MVRRHIPVIFLLAIVLCAFAIPFFASAAGQPFWGPIVECGYDDHPCQFCDLAQLAQNLISVGISVATIIAVLLFVWAGFQYITAGGNESQIHHAHQIFWNVLIGFILLLLAWLIVDSIMKAFLSDDFKNYGVWNQIECRPQPKGGLASSGSDGGGVETSIPSAPLPLDTGNCAASNLKTVASQNGYTLSDGQAAALSCISIPESNCNNNAVSPTGARGVFQIIVGYHGKGGAHDDCHDLNMQACTTAAQSAGYTVSGGKLDCFFALNSGGNPKPGKEKEAAACQTAARNFECNTAAAACLVKQKPSLNDWTADSHSSKQKACIAKYNH